MNTITEIIPDDMPEWAKQAMDEGQFFNVVCERLKELETALVQSCNAARLYGYRDSAPMIDVMRVRRTII